MKRLLCAALVISLLFCVSGCGKKEKPPVTLDLEYYVRLGKIPESECVLGVSAADIERDSQRFLKDGRVCLEKDGVIYCYAEGDETKTVKYIISMKGGYGFTAGTDVSEITAELSKGDMNAPLLPLERKEIFVGEPYFRETASEETGYFGIKYTYGENTACFIFKDNRLCACTMH